MTETIVRCVYCGVEMDEAHSNNPWDNGLHPNYDKYTDDDPKYCCSKCSTVTSINRALADMIHAEDPTRVIRVLRQEADWIEENIKELTDYYRKRRDEYDRSKLNKN